MLPNVVVIEGKREEEGEKVKHERNQKVYHNKNNQHIHFFMHGHSSWSTFGLHLVRGPKAINLHFS